MWLKQQKDDREEYIEAIRHELPNQTVKGEDKNGFSGNMAYL